MIAGKDESRRADPSLDTSQTPNGGASSWPVDERSPSQLTKRPTTPARLAGLFRLVHPFPSILNAVVVSVFACVSVGGWPGIAVVASLSLTMLCIQFAIGALNDWADRDLDAGTKPEKPIPAGLVSHSAALTLAVTLGGAAFALSLREGVAAALLAMTGLAIGVAYDLGVKRTPFSAVTYALALPLIPVWVWTATDRLNAALLAVVPLGMLLGFGLQLANALPDDEGDREAGVRGAVQWLGAQRARRLCWFSFAVSLLLALLLSGLVGLNAPTFLPFWAAASVLTVAAVLVYLLRPGARALKLGWASLALSTAVLAVGWFVALP